MFKCLINLFAGSQDDPTLLMGHNPNEFDQGILDAVREYDQGKR